MLCKKKLFYFILLLCFICIPKVRALDTVNYNQWNFVYRDGTVGQTWDNSFIYRLGENKSLQAVNVYWPSFQGYYNGTITIQLDPVQFPSNPNGFLTNQFFKLFVYQNGSYSQQYYIGTCDGQWTCTFNFQGTAEQLSTNRFSVQLLMNNEPFSTAYIMYPAARISASVFVSNEANTGNQDIINNQNDNTQNIINNQNENTDKEIESQNVCRIIDSSSIVDDNKALSATGGDFANNTAGITDYISLDGVVKLSKLTNDTSLSNRICFYRNNININSVISCFQQSDIAIGNITIPDNAKFVRFTIIKSTNAPSYSICKNGNQAISDKMQDINNSINDDSSPDTSGFIQSITGMLPTDTPITTLLSMPIILINRFLDSMNGTCQPFNLGTLYGHQLIMPCINPVDYFGQNVWNLIDGLFCIFMIYNIAMLCITIYESITNLDDTMAGLYEPRHAYTGYQPKHGG